MPLDWRPPPGGKLPKTIALATCGGVSALGSIKVIWAWFMDLLSLFVKKPPADIHHIRRYSRALRLRAARPQKLEIQRLLALAKLAEFQYHEQLLIS